MTLRTGRWLWLIIAAAIALYIWNKHHTPRPTPAPLILSDSTPHPAPVPKVAQPVTQLRAAAPVVAPPPAIHVVTPKAGVGMNYAKQGLVHFKIINGLAIAFGDVLLGRLVGGDNIQEGLYKPPPLHPWKTAEIAYAITRDLPRPERVEQALEYFRQYTPVNFVPYTNQKDALVFEVGEEHCYSYVGRIGGLQPIRLSDECTWQEILHETMHALGFVHEQSRTDRDAYVEVLWDNIDDAFKNQFAMVPDSLMEPLRGTPFDFQSVMMYPPTAFARENGLVTLRSLGNTAIAPTPNGLSPQDLDRLNHFFNETR